MNTAAERVGALRGWRDRDCCDSGILLSWDRCGCLIAFLKEFHFIFYANRGRVCSGEVSWVSRQKALMMRYNKLPVTVAVRAGAQVPQFPRCQSFLIFNKGFHWPSSFWLFWRRGMLFYWVDSIKHQWYGWLAENWCPTSSNLPQRFLFSSLVHFLSCYPRTKPLSTWTPVCAWKQNNLVFSHLLEFWILVFWEKQPLSKMMKFICDVRRLDGGVSSCCPLWF